MKVKGFNYQLLDTPNVSARWVIQRELGKSRRRQRREARERYGR